ncbi:MAG: hypothetical protein KKD35_02610 [Elusimicrobia bacterium]|nr:hypothetical protein [Elusimicrobiota bacterium]
MNEQTTNIRQKLFALLGKYWWVLLILVVILAFTTDVPIFQYVLWGVGIIFALMIFAPVLFQLFAPGFFLISSLIEHFKESKGQSAGKRYVFIPAALLATVGFVTAQSILSIWVFILSFLIWASVIGFFFTFLTVFFLGLAPLAIFTAPFVVWFQAGFIEFLGVVIFFLITLFWFGFSKMAFSEDYWKSTPEDFLGYSPHTFLLGALSFQVVALPFYNFGLNGAGDIISDAGGFIFLLLALIAAFKWRAIKKKLSETEQERLYRPSVWIYIFGFFLTNLLYAEFTQKFGAPTAVLFWLNGFFLVAILGRFFGLFRRKKKPAQIQNEA